MVLAIRIRRGTPGQSAKGKLAHLDMRQRGGCRSKRKSATIKKAHSQTSSRIKRSNDLANQTIMAITVAASTKPEFKMYDDWTVALGVSKIVNQPVAAVYTIMKYWEKPILKAPIPGVGGRVPDESMLNSARKAAIRFIEAEAAKDEASHVVQAFRLVTGETGLHFAWEHAKNRISRAKLDCSRAIDSWEQCLAMQSGETNATSEIYVCGTRRITLRALTSLICHEGLHNLARRTRPGNPYLSEELEHLAMALLGDPQLSG